MDLEMRSRIFKIVLILGLPLTISIFYYRKLTIFYPGDDLLGKKMGYLYECGDKPDIIFLGSSRVLNCIDPRVIDSVCGTNSYNLGLNGINVAEMRMLSRVCMETDKRPRILVINLDPSSFNVRDPVFSFADILSYAEKDTVVYNAMAEVQKVYAWKWKYPFYRLQKLTAINDGFKVDALLRSKEGFRREMTAPSEAGAAMTHYKGFVANYAGYTETYVTPFNEKFDAKGFDLLRDIIRSSIQRGIRVVLVTAPMYEDYRSIFLNAGCILSKVSELAKEESVPYFNMIDDSLSLRKENFFNFVHLNGRAAECYSFKLAVILKSIDTVAGHQRPTPF
jgi:hypothetical protein